MRRKLLVIMAALATSLAMTVPAVGAPGGDNGPKEGTPAYVKTESKLTDKKLHPKLREEVDSGSTAPILVSVTAASDGSDVTAMMSQTHVATFEGASLVVGSVATQNLRKVAALESVVSVVPIEFKQTGSPLGSPEPEIDVAPSTATLQSFLNNLHKQEVPYSEAPPLAASNFDDLKNLDVLDANTHNFTEAWAAGYTGEGSTVAVLDGGTDFGHPDLVGTWRTGPSGWPLAFDPYGTLIWLTAPSLVSQGLSWYTLTEERGEADFSQNAQDKKNGLYRVTFATMTGPARNFSAPSGTISRQYTFPAEWADNGSVRLGSHPDDHLLQLFGERPAIIVVDSTGSGYDTIYVDLDGDYEFADEKPVTKESPVSYRDMNGDGYTDLSGGLVYHISDGATPLPGGPLAFGAAIVAAPGELIAWSGDFDPAIGGHGTQTASNVVGQGVINGLAPTFDDIGTYPGAVIGGAPDAKLAPFGDIYFAHEFSTQFGYLLANSSWLFEGVPIDATSNSYGSSSTDNDGYDAASQEADFWNLWGGGLTTALFSTGNGAPGFGTTSPPAPFTGVAVGASTQFGGTGWDSIASASQIVDNDVMVWSNRGPGATGANGVDLVADGAFSAGDVTLNTVLDGRLAWDTWGGTSRSTPVVAGAVALVYQAARDAGGSPDMFSVKAALVSSAQDLGYDSWNQGGGSLDAYQATQAITGATGVLPATDWRPGDYRGTEYDVFTHLLSPGNSDTQTFTLDGSGSYSIGDRQLVRTDVVNLDLESTKLNKEGAYHFNAPNYLIDVSDVVAAHPDADLMVVRAVHPYASFDANADYNADQMWRLMTYNWTDVNGDGDLWNDKDGDGAVDVKSVAGSSNIDGFTNINYAASEIDEGEYVRFMYHRAFANSLMNFVREPADRMADGIFLGLQHPQTSGANQTTSIDVQIEFYENEDWDWLSTDAGVSGGGSFNATMVVPDDAAPGMYNGAITLTNNSDPSDVIVLPVSLTVGATATQDDTGKISDVLTFGGSDVAAAQQDYMYNNGAVFDAKDWSWRAESGDWRFFYFDVEEEPAPGSLLLVSTTWEDDSPPTDLDTLVFGRSSNVFQVGPDLVLGGPYILDTVGGSTNTNVGAGVWLFDTATGGAEELVAAPVQEGLHAIVQHTVNHSGEPFLVPFEINVGGATVDPASVMLDSPTTTGNFALTFEAGLDLTGLVAEGFGLAQPDVTAENAAQDDPNDPSSASVKKDVTIEHAASLEVATVLGTDDLDLFLVFDANGDGSFTNGEIVASSTTGSSNEHIFISAPADGDYQVWVQGWSVSGTPGFTLLVDAVQGFDVTVTGVPAGAVPAGTPVNLNVDFDKGDMVGGETYFGIVQLGPPTAPSAVFIPIEITYNP